MTNIFLPLSSCIKRQHFIYKFFELFHIKLKDALHFCTRIHIRLCISFFFYTGVETLLLKNDSIIHDLCKLFNS